MVGSFLDSGSFLRPRLALTRDSKGILCPRLADERVARSEFDKPLLILKEMVGSFLDSSIFSVYPGRPERVCQALGAEALELRHSATRRLASRGSPESPGGHTPSFPGLRKNQRSKRPTQTYPSRRKCQGELAHGAHKHSMFRRPPVSR